MSRVLTLLAAVVAVLIGGLRPDSVAWRGGSPGSKTDDAAHAWAAANGYRFESSETLDNSATYVLYRVTRPGGCHLIVAPLGNPDEILPLLQNLLSAEIPGERRLLLTTLQDMPETALGVHYRRLRSRLVEHRGAQPVMLLGDARCMFGEAGGPLSPWPEL
jgi:hypothetical protein